MLCFDLLLMGALHRSGGFDIILSSTGSPPLLFLLPLECDYALTAAPAL